MPRKEDRWVAVAPQFSGNTSASAGTEKIRSATSAYAFFQKDVTPVVKSELQQQHPGGKYNIGDFSRAIRERWNQLDDTQRSHYEELARDDQARFARESHAADVAALQRRQQLQQDHQQLLLLDTDTPQPQRSTRNQYKQQQHQQSRPPPQRKKKKPKKKKVIRDDDDESEDDDDESEESYHEVDDDENEGGEEEEEESSFDSDEKEKRKKKKASPAKAPRRPASQKQVAHREKVRQQREEKVTFIAQRQDDLRKERVDQAKRRLEFLLQQSDIFSHFGQVQQDQVKYGIKAIVTTKKADTSATTRRGAATAEAETLDAQELEQETCTNTTYLTTQPSTLSHGEMRPYQLEGLNWMIRLQENGVNGILADEMGLGKTLQSISILVYMMEYQQNSGPHLVVVPKSTLSNWMAELGRWAPTLKAIKFHGDKDERTALAQVLLNSIREEERDWNVCITTYEVCNIEKNVLGKFAWTYLIIDEAHRLKNEASAFSKTVRTFETKFRILLTGTPLQNSLHELWALLNFLVPDVFASAEQFDEWFNLDIDDVNEKNKLISQLHKILRPFMLRRLKADVEKSLPPKHETILFTGMSVMQKKLYRDILLRDFDALQGKTGSQTAILNIVMQLRKCAGHPYLFPGVEDRTLPPLGEHLVENCGKMVVLDKLLRRLHERGHRVLLFTQMTRILDIMEDYLVMRRFPYCRIDGNTTYEQRENYIDAFNAPESEKFIFLLSTRAGGLGINLQTADVVILYDSDWNPQADLQAQDRAHRIGQKKPVQVFRLVTEHTIEEKIVERAQKKLKLDAMVVQQGRFRDKDKLSREELLEAVKFGADKIFKSKDSSITDDDIDMILDAGKRKTQELNEKLKVADKGDLLDFKLDGGTSVRTFEGVDYANNALANAKAEADLLGIIDIGKRERRAVANYNESALYQQQIAVLGASKQRSKPKVIKLPKTLRLPRMEEWQMYDRVALQQIQEEEEAAFRSLPEEQQKMAALMSRLENEESLENEQLDNAPNLVELPPLLSPERQAEKERLMSEGFVSWKRHHYSAFVKACSRYGRSNVAKIALEVAKSESEVQEYANSFWGDKGKNRISEHEYERAVKLIERGEKKINELKGLERGTRVLLSIFDNPWEELEFTYVNCRDKMFTMEEDRYLLCWTHKFGYGQWEAIKMAIRRNPNFRFDYFLRSLPTDMIGRRCEQLMKAAEKEVEQLERKAREDAGLPVEAEEEGAELSPVKLPSFLQMQRHHRTTKQHQAESQKKQLEEKVDELEDQMHQIEERLKELNEMKKGDPYVKSSFTDENVRSGRENRSRRGDGESEAHSQHHEVEEENHGETREGGAIGPDGTFVEFPEYDGSEAPKEYKKAFTHFCNATRRDVKASLSAEERKDKTIVNNVLRDQFLELSDEDKKTWKNWATWDKQRYEYQLRQYEKQKATLRPTPIASTEVLTPESHVPKKRASDEGGFAPIPKRRR